MSNFNTVENNPCFEEYKISMKCLDDNGYDRDKCNAAFENYKTCKKFWGYIQRERKSKGIKPYLPSVEERAKIKAEYFTSFK